MNVDFTIFETTNYMSGNDQVGKYEQTVSLFVTFQGDLEIKNKQKTVDKHTNHIHTVAKDVFWNLAHFSKIYH